MGGRFGRNFIVYGLIAVVLLVVVFMIFGGSGGSSDNIPLAGGTESLLGRIDRDQGLIETVRVDTSQVTLEYRDGLESFTANIPRPISTSSISSPAKGSKSLKASPT